MLTLQQILESDSIASLVAKLNTNFQVLSNSNGGPQGIRGPQGIPGLPGRLGPTGVTGPVGPTGSFFGIVPFACIGDSTAGVGPTAGVYAGNGQAANPWPLASWTWLMTYHGGGIVSSFSPLTTGTGTTATHGDVFADHANNGYWKYLSYPDVPGACDGGTTTYPDEYLNGGFYGATGLPGASYPDFNGGTGWVGNGWYWYPISTSSGLTSTVWLNDYTTYFVGAPTGPYIEGPYTSPIGSPLTVANARLLSKYGTVWITSGSDGTVAGSDDSLTTETIGLWGSTAMMVSQINPGKSNAGIDRLLFKMSIDTLPYASNIQARGFTAATGQAYNPISNFPQGTGGTAMTTDAYWVKPQYETLMTAYSPLLFLSERNVGATDSNFSSLGLYMHTSDDPPTLRNNEKKSLFLWSSRSAPDPNDMFPAGLSPINSSETVNYGEFILDTRRLIASNQYVCSLPTDMKLSSDYIDPLSSSYNEDDINNNFAYRTYQGYISAINGKSLTGDPLSINYWEYGLGDGSVYGPTGGTHDNASGTAGMQTRKTWYGSSVLDELPDDWENFTPGDGNYIRVAGMMERGRRFDDLLDIAGVGTGTNFLSELIFYTSHFKYDLAGATGLTNDEVDPTINSHKSLPVMYVSPYRNIGIGTFVGNTYNTNDKGPLEPSALLHVHTKQRLPEDDPTYVYTELTPGTPGSFEAKLPYETFAAAAFSGDYGGGGYNYVTDILLGNLYTQQDEWVNPTLGSPLGVSDVVNRMSDNQTSDISNNYLRNAIRTESWFYTRHNTLRLGAQPFLNSNAIGRGDITHFKNEFQLAIHPLIKNSYDMADSNQAISGVGIHNLYPRTRAHFYGKNLYNEVDWGQESVYPTYTIYDGLSTGLSNNYPYYGPTANNQPSTNQISIDYIGDSYTYPVGIYDYQYLAYGATSNPSSTGTASPNAAVYPRRDSISPTRHFVPYATTTINLSYPSVNPGVVYNNSYKHGGTTNAWWEPTSYIGFNLFRDVSEAGTTGGDNRNNTRWILGTSDNANDTTGNNGGAAIISSPHGELGIVSIPRGRDGGAPYSQWEQRGLGTRDVLNQMKIVFDKNGNIAIGNAAGWDYDAYPSLDRSSSTGYLYYIPNSGATAAAPGTGGNAGNTSGKWEGNYQYGRVSYTSLGYSETSSNSSAALINSNATVPEYIRLEVAAEKAWSRDGRMLQKAGWGYPRNSTLVISAPEVDYYILTDGSLPTISDFTLTTDEEGRLDLAEINFSTSASGATSGNFQSIVFPHPTEFNAGGILSGLAPGYKSPVGAIAAEWWSMSVDSPLTIAETLGASFDTIFEATTTKFWVCPTYDIKGSANVRLNNFVYGEGWGGDETSGPTPSPFVPTALSEFVVKYQRQQSPKFVLTFLEGDVSAYEASKRGAAGTTPYKKVSTVVQSAQNESPLREYWIPKSDNTGGTFMVFTDHFGQKEKDTGFDETSILIEPGATGGGATAASGLHLDQVVTMEFLAKYTGVVSSVTGGTSNSLNCNGNGSFIPGLSTVSPYNMYPGYVRYYNRDYLWGGQDSIAFAANEYGRKQTINFDDSVTDLYQLGDDNDPYTTFVLGVSQPNSYFENGNGDTAQNDATLIELNSITTEEFIATVIDDSNIASLTSGPTGTVGTVAEFKTGLDYITFAPTTTVYGSTGSNYRPEKIKITVDIESNSTSQITIVGGATATNLAFRWLPSTGNYRGVDFWNGVTNFYESTNESLVQFLPISYTPDNTNLPSLLEDTAFGGTMEFYIDWDDWYSVAGTGDWKLCMMASAVATSTFDENNFGTILNNCYIKQLRVKFEPIFAPNSDAVRVNTAEIEDINYNLATYQRNIDYFYSIYNPATNFDNGWNTVGNAIGAPVIENKASAIRFKRINSEFALVDFNITVKVDNPNLDGTPGTLLGDYIDFCSPRFTQYMRFVYVPDEDFDTEPNYRQDIAQDIFGNGFWFSNWSSYKQWYAGSAIVGSEYNPVTGGPGNRSYYDSTSTSQYGTMLRNTTSDDSPYFMDNTTGQGWNGNLLDMLSYYLDGQYIEENIYKSEGNITTLDVVPAGPGSTLSKGGKSGIYSMFGHDRRILNIAKRVFNRLNTISLDSDTAKQWGMTRYLGAAYSLWHNHTFMRNKNIQWRMVPAKSYIYEVGAASSSPEPRNNTFVLEVQFSDPILHVDTPLGQRAFYGSSAYDTDTKSPYQYLTVSGQSIVRYAETIADART